MLLPSFYISHLPHHLHSLHLSSTHTPFLAAYPHQNTVFISTWVPTEFPSVTRHLSNLATMVPVIWTFGPWAPSRRTGLTSLYKWAKMLISCVTMRWESRMALVDGVALVCYPYLSFTVPHSYPPPLSVSPKGAPSPSALFARRLMHFCSDEVAAQASSPAVSFHDSTSSPNVSPFSHPPSSYPVTPQDASEDAIEDLADGLDVLLILERAYERALKAHVIPPSPQASTPSLPASSKPEPLLTGSSTALLAVLDSAGSHMPKPEVSVVPDTRVHDAVIRIAHLGDCMGMLVRGDEIVWRSEEMWWAVRCSRSSLSRFIFSYSPPLQFNTPLQLGPASSTPPSMAQVITLPVRADDILVLASDGLSDNLWDEDMLDEVVRFRHTFLASNVTSGSQLPRRALAGMLSEALCSRARRVSQRRFKTTSAAGTFETILEVDDEIPFGRRAREEGRPFNCRGKPDGEYRRL